MVKADDPHRPVILGGPIGNENAHRSHLPSSSCSGGLCEAGKTITFGEIERRIGLKIGAWNKVLDPIYEDCRTQGHPDLTAIIIYKEPFFSDGGEARSKRFNPNNLRPVGRWQEEVTRVFSTWKAS